MIQSSVRSSNTSCGAYTCNISCTRPSEYSLNTILFISIRRATTSTHVSLSLQHALSGTQAGSRRRSGYVWRTSGRKTRTICWITGTETSMSLSHCRQLCARRVKMSSPGCGHPGARSCTMCELSVSRRIQNSESVSRITKGRNGLRSGAFVNYTVASSKTALI